MTTMVTDPHVDKESNPWESQRARFDLAAQKLNLDEGLWRVLRYPNRELTVYIPVQMDDGHLEVFTGFRVQHSIARGPICGSAMSARTRSRRSTSPRWRAPAARTSVGTASKAAAGSPPSRSRPGG